MSPCYSVRVCLQRMFVQMLPNLCFFPALPYLSTSNPNYTSSLHSMYIYIYIIVLPKIQNPGSKKLMGRNRMKEFTRQEHWRKEHSNPCKIVASFTGLITLSSPQTTIIKAHKTNTLLPNKHICYTPHILICSHQETHLKHKCSFFFFSLFSTYV